MVGTQLIVSSPRKARLHALPRRGKRVAHRLSYASFGAWDEPMWSKRCKVLRPQNDVEGSTTSISRLDYSQGGDGGKVGRGGNVEGVPS